MNAKRAGKTQRKPKSKAARQEPFSYHPNDALAHAIVKAWTDPNDFGKRLLTLSVDGPKKKKIESTQRALAEYGVYLENPVVLTEDEYKRYKKERDEVVFVLPDAPGRTEGQNSLDTARVKMAFTLRGM